MSEEEYDRLLKQFVQKVRNAITIKQFLTRLIEVGRRTGRTDIQIGDDIRKEFRGQLDDRTIRLYLPDSLKHKEKANRPDAAIDPHPRLPPPPQVVREAEVQPEPPQTQTKSTIVKMVFDPSQMDRNDRTQVFILYIDITTGKIVKYETVGRKMISI